MQNRYFGDVGDYGKYGLLRHLCNKDHINPQLSLSIIWYLVPDEGHNDDGKHISYLQKPEFRDCDPTLYDTLKNILSTQPRSVNLIQKACLFPKETIYFDDFLTYNSMHSYGIAARNLRLAHRKHWIDKALDISTNSDVIFIDPDNGFEVKSVKKYNNKGPKYIFWDEFKQFHYKKQTLVVYHHLSRTFSSREQIAIKLAQFKEIIGSRIVIPVLFKRGSHRVFFIIPNHSHKTIIQNRLKSYACSAWAEHIEIF